MIKNIQSQKGFTLIELSIALVVISLLMVAYLQLDAIQEKKYQSNLQRAKIFTIADGLARFRSENGHFPCPARLDLGPLDTGFGMPTINGVGAASDDCNTIGVLPADVTAPGTFANGYYVADLGGKRVRIGALPYKVLGVGKEDIIDIYGNKFTYAVVEEQASPSTPYTEFETSNVNHVIAVKDYDFDPFSFIPETGIYTAGNDIVVPVDMVFFSHGENGAGSHLERGKVHPMPCEATGAAGDPATTNDSENCSIYDGIFATERFVSRSPAGLGGDFDDFLVSDLVQWIYIWDASLASEEDVYNRSDGNMAVGHKNPVERMHVKGNLRVDMKGDATVPDPNLGKIQTEILCDEAKEDCFAPAHLGGPEGAEETLHCNGDKPMMRKVKLTNSADSKTRKLDSGIACTSAVGTDSIKCDDTIFSFMNGIEIDPNTGVITKKCGNVF